MDYSYEKYFIRTFIRKNRQKRLLHELSAEKKRYRGIDRFCHQAAELIDQKKILMKGKDLINDPSFRRFIAENNQECYVLSTDSFLNERMMPLLEASDLANMSTEAVLIIGKDFALVFGEAMKGARDRFLLTDKENT